ncbi:hypothetical protein NCS56_01373800 [Fusarium sp. Ph1]|nr:hypothetical protein NCS56_01373800 [Fusarium sp. Ph1]
MMASKPDRIQHSLLWNKGAKFCRFLLDHGAETQVDVLSFRRKWISKGETPLHVAIENIPKIPDPLNKVLEPWSGVPVWAYDRISWLLEAGADVHIPNSIGSSCLDLAFCSADDLEAEEDHYPTRRHRYNREYPSF